MKNLSRRIGTFIAAGTMVGLLAEAFGLPPCDSTVPTNNDSNVQCYDGGDCLNGAYKTGSCSYTQWDIDYSMCICAQPKSSLLKCGDYSPVTKLTGVKTPYSGGTCMSGVCTGASPGAGASDTTNKKVAVSCGGG